MIRTAQASASNSHCISANQSEPEKIMVQSMSPIDRWTCSIALLLIGFLIVVDTAVIT